MIPTKKPIPKEENAIVLDYLEHGYSLEQGQNKTAIVQALGLNHLTLLELIPKKGVQLQPHQEVYIGEGKREEIHHIKGRIFENKLTSTARNELVHALDKVVGENEAKFLQFFNKAGPLSMRMHQLELLPGLGKKHMWEVIQARKARPFESFDDLKERVKLIPDPKGMVVKRIMKEIKGDEKYKIYTQ